MTTDGTNSNKEGGGGGGGQPISQVLPKKGLVYTEQAPMLVLCKPKILPLKSVTLEKLEKMQKDAQETIKKQEEEERLHETLLAQQQAIEDDDTME